MPYHYARPGWNVETSHPIEENDEAPVCETCLNTVDPTIAFAADWGSTAHGHTMTDSDGNSHTVVVRQIIEEA